MKKQIRELKKGDAFILQGQVFSVKRKNKISGDEISDEAWPKAAKSNTVVYLECTMIDGRTIKIESLGFSLGSVEVVS